AVRDRARGGSATRSNLREHRAGHARLQRAGGQALVGEHLVVVQVPAADGQLAEAAFEADAGVTGRAEAGAGTGAGSDVSIRVEAIVDPEPGAQPAAQIFLPREHEARRLI